MLLASSQYLRRIVDLDQEEIRIARPDLPDEIEFADRSHQPLPLLDYARDGAFRVCQLFVLQRILYAFDDGRRKRVGGLHRAEHANDGFGTDYGAAARAGEAQCF